MAPNLTELNRFFNTPSPCPRTPRAAVERLNRSVQSSPFSSSSTLVADEDENARKTIDVSLVNQGIEADIKHCPILLYHSKPYVDEFVQRAGYNRTWWDVQNHLAIPQISKNDYSTPPTEVSRDFNPYAAPFIPARPYIQPSSQNFTPLGVPRPPWFGAFWAGTGMCTLREREKHACVLVDHQRWSTTSIAELAQHFCWKGCEGLSVETSAVASFARAVYMRFKVAHGEGYASSFLDYFGAMVFGTFKAHWLLASNRGQPPMISSALCLCMFIGDIFTLDLVPADPVYTCIFGLLTSLHSLEDMHALHFLLLHTNRKLWLRRADGASAMRNLITVITQRAKGVKIPPGTKGIRLEEVPRWMEEIVAMIDRWHAVLCPGPGILSRNPAF